MENQRRELRQRDECDMDFDSGSETEDFPSDNDDDFTIGEEIDEQMSDHSDEDDVEPLEQNVGEEIARNPTVKYLSKNKKIQYSTQPFEHNQRHSYRRANNIVSGPKPVATANVADVLSSFELFLRPIENSILNMTNLYGVRKYKEEWQKIDMDTLHAYFGLLLLAGVYRSYGECVTQLWNEKTGRAIFRDTMSLKMFKKIHGCIRFDDKEERIANAASVRDKLAPIRTIYEKWNNNLKDVYTPSKNVTIDEQLVPFRGRCPFRQYIPSKPAKYGIKIWVLTDSASSYVYNTQIYVGRNRNAAPERNIGCRVVLDLVDGLSERNVTCDNFFTSYELAEELHKRRMTILGTIRKHRNEIPPVLVDMKKKPVYSSVVAYDHKLQAILLSYVPRRYKYVILLSTYHTDVVVREDTERKPNLIEDYNKTKSGLDTMDQMVSIYTCKRKINRWPMAVFCNILDVSALNAYITYISLFPAWKSNKTNKNIRRRLFIEELGMALVQNFIEKRKSRPRRGNTDVPTAITHLPKTAKRARCFICTYKTNKNLYANRCDSCKNYVCNDHHYNICETCTNKGT